MNINTKAILASTILTALFAGTSAYADGDKDQFFYENTVSTESIVIQKANYQAPSISAEIGIRVSGQK